MDDSGIKHSICLSRLILIWIVLLHIALLNNTFAVFANDNSRLVQSVPYEVTVKANDDTDLSIHPETITWRRYSGPAISDEYEIKMLTAESYRKASLIDAKHKEEYAELQTNLSLDVHCENEADSFLDRIESMGLFGDDYEASSTANTIKADKSNIPMIISFLTLGGMIGCVLAFFTKKRQVL